MHIRNPISHSVPEKLGKELSIYYVIKGVGDYIMLSRLGLLVIFDYRVGGWGPKSSKS